MTITGVFSTTLLGKIGDEKSRKLAMIVPLIGLLLADFVLLFLTWFSETSPYLYVLSETLFGLCGGYVTILSSSFAYGSHLAKVSGFHRSKAMSVLEGAIGIGSVIGFFCTSFIKSTGYLNAYFVMTGIHILCIIFVLSLNDIKPTKEILEEKRKGFFNRLGNKLTVSE
uniref:Major facilitator superfamily (MFS) profile domain-containing protein n=1 Tax=Panagrolaimus sp. ES5 TaxID=591445 RepID=A0AC34G022_9BILA